MKNLSAVIVLVLGAFASPGQEKPAAQENPVCLMHLQQKPSAEDQHHKGVVQRGDEVMEFSHEKTTHHFRVRPDGGAIEVEANKLEDTESRDAIRVHLAHIAKMFAAGDFSAPMLIPFAESTGNSRDEAAARSYPVQAREHGTRRAHSHHHERSRRASSRA
jgi:hypothetical protein